MKRNIHLLSFKSIVLILLGLSLVFVTSCNKGKKSNGDKANGRPDLAVLLTEEMIRTTFEVADSIDLEQDIDEVAMYISYTWSVPTGDEYIIESHSVSLNFSNEKPLNKTMIDARWESQNEGIYKDKNMEEVSGVGTKASWSTLGTGQLRIATNQDLFFISFTLFQLDAFDPDKKFDDPWSKNYRIEKSKILGNEIIEKLY